MSKRLDSLRIRRVALVDNGADQHADVVLFKHADGGGENIVPVNLDSLPEALRKHFEESTQEVVDAVAEQITTAESAIPDETKTEMERLQSELEQAQSAGSEGTGEEGEGSDVMKGLPEEARALIEKEQKDREELQKRLDAEIEKREIRDHVEVAKTEYAHVAGISHEDLGAILYRMTKNVLTDEDTEKLRGVLKSTSETTRESIVFKEIGSGQRGSGSAQETIEKIAQRIRSEQPTLSAEQAYTKALDTPEGQEAYERDRLARNGLAVN